MMYDISGYDSSDTDLARIATMIRATILPQNAIDLCSKILCDADMDYLGRLILKILPICYARNGLKPARFSQKKPGFAAGELP
jgi:hypothetical protein